MPVGSRGSKTSDLEQSDWKHWVRLELSDQGPGGHYTNAGFPLRQKVTDSSPQRSLLSFLVSHQSLPIPSHVLSFGSLRPGK